MTSKLDFVRRYGRGEFGNLAPTWDRLVDFQLSGYQYACHIRNRIAGGPTWYDIPARDVSRRWVELVQGGVDPAKLYISAMAPHRYGTIQGEIIQSTEHLTLTYCSARMPMRDAMQLGTKTAEGILAVSLLRRYMDPPSYDWLGHLLDAYSGHVIEFSCFDVCWGTIPNRNTVFWEVRNY